MPAAVNKIIWQDDTHKIRQVEQTDSKGEASYFYQMNQGNSEDGWKIVDPTPIRQEKNKTTLQVGQFYIIQEEKNGKPVDTLRYFVADGNLTAQELEGSKWGAATIKKPSFESVDSGVKIFDSNEGMRIYQYNTGNQKQPVWQLATPTIREVEPKSLNLPSSKDAPHLAELAEQVAASLPPKRVLVIGEMSITQEKRDNQWQDIQRTFVDRGHVISETLNENTWEVTHTEPVPTVLWSSDPDLSVRKVRNSAGEIFYQQDTKLKPFPVWETLEPIVIEQKPTSRLIQIGDGIQIAQKLIDDQWVDTQRLFPSSKNNTTLLQEYQQATQSWQTVKTYELAWQENNKKIRKLSGADGSSRIEFNTSKDISNPIWVAQPLTIEENKATKSRTIKIGETGVVIEQNLSENKWKDGRLRFPDEEGFEVREKLDGKKWVPTSRRKVVQQESTNEPETLLDIWVIGENGRGSWQRSKSAVWTEQDTREIAELSEWIKSGKFRPEPDVVVPEGTAIQEDDKTAPELIDSKKDDHAPVEVPTTDELPRYTPSYDENRPNKRWYHSLLGVEPRESAFRHDDLAISETIAFQMKVLWAKTYLPSDVYTAPDAKNSGGTLYGKPIPREYLYGFADGKIGSPNEYPYSNIGRVKAFFGFPYREEGKLSPVKMIGFFLKVVPRTLINPIKLVTEIGTGFLVAVTNKFTAYAAHRYQASEGTGPAIGWYALLTLARGLHGTTNLLHFVGKATTSPMQNVQDTWAYFADMRASNKWYVRAAGWIGGILGGAFSITVTATIYGLLAPFAAAAAGVVATALGVGAAYSAATAAVGTVLAPVTSFLASTVGPAITFAAELLLGKAAALVISSPVLFALGAAAGILVPTVIAPVVNVVDRAVGAVANAIGDGLNWIGRKISSLRAKPEPVVARVEESNQPKAPKALESEQIQKEQVQKVNGSTVSILGSKPPVLEVPVLPPPSSKEAVLEKSTEDLFNAFIEASKASKSLSLFEDQELKKAYLAWKKSFVADLRRDYANQDVTKLQKKMEQLSITNQEALSTRHEQLAEALREVNKKIVDIDHQIQIIDTKIGQTKADISSNKHALVMVDSLIQATQKDIHENPIGSLKRREDTDQLPLSREERLKELEARREILIANRSDEKVEESDQQPPSRDEFLVAMQAKKEKLMEERKVAVQEQAKIKAPFDAIDFAETQKYVTEYNYLSEQDRAQRVGLASQSQFSAKSTSREDTTNEIPAPRDDGPTYGGL